MKKIHHNHHHRIWSFILYLSLLLATHFLQLSSTANPGQTTNCWTQRANLSQNDFVLECTDDGHFKSVQCDNKTGYCFCVDPNTGRPNTLTTTKNRHLDCNHIIEQRQQQKQQQQQHYQQQQQQSSSYNSRRQPLFSNPLKDPSTSFQPIAAAQSQLIPNKQKRGRSKRCLTGQRISYIDQIVSKIQQQQQQQRQNVARIPLGIYRPRPTRLPSLTSSASASLSNSNEFNPIIRKFNDFDHNKDHSLSQIELKLMIDELTQLETNHHQHQSQLQSCADSMFDFCDHNHDQNITRIEFIHCLNLRNTQILNEDYLQRRRQQRRGGGGGGGGNDNLSSKNQNVFNYDNAFNDNDNDDPAMSTSSIAYDGQGSSIRLLMEMNSSQSNQTGTDRSGKESRKESRKDCQLIRSNSIESARVNPNGLVFIPECTADGYYVRVQCHHMHCWCVSRVTGHTIKALNKNSSENLEACDLMRKGCDQRRRMKFHKQFRQRISSHGFTCDSIFNQIDNGYDQKNELNIDENEFKSFIRLWSTKLSINSRLKKCLRTEIHYCDQNDDGRLSKNEWIQCCNDNITVTNILLSSSSSSSSSLSTDRSSNYHQFNAGRRDSGLYPGSNFFSTEFAKAYNQKKNRPRFGQNPLKILNSE
ncbi:SPARC related modular calcium binding-like protein magu isoform X2 [Dermatophagoides pteronyssinus]|uniref:SPARC related modular calcium binding-like protein magu isoform X2 n=1 Tax=Dermatophagoides pteronyssinus TaxID=6956 RepID=UPI003F680396